MFIDKASVAAKIIDTKATMCPDFIEDKKAKEVTVTDLALKMNIGIRRCIHSDDCTCDGFYVDITRCSGMPLKG